MNPYLAANGWLIRDPATRPAKSGAGSCPATLAVSAPTGRDVGNKEPEIWWLGVVVFGRGADNQGRPRTGEPIAVSELRRLGRYTTPTGEERQRWTVIADPRVSTRMATDGVSA